MKSLWIKLDGKWKNIKPLVTASIESGVDVLVLDEANVKNVKELARDIKIAAKNKNSDIQIIEVNTKTDLKELKKNNCALIEIDSKIKEELAEAAGKIADWVMIKTKDWKIIPLENLIAKLRKERGKLLACASTLEDVKVAQGILETGVDGVVLTPKNTSEVKKAKEILMSLSKEKIELKPAKITKIKPIGLGDRVCVDTVSILNLGEGLLIGSQSKGFFLIHSETVKNPYVETRPFRVNAGTVHAYLKVSKDKTKYLSELKSGDEVLIVNNKGETRIENVGRIKIERRPLLLIEAECEGEIIKTIIQNAETIRLVDSRGKPISISRLKVGDEVLVDMEHGGRHFGIKIEENLLER